MSGNGNMQRSFLELERFYYTFRGSIKFFHMGVVTLCVWKITYTSPLGVHYSLIMTHLWFLCLVAFFMDTIFSKLNIASKLNTVRSWECSFYKLKLIIFPKNNYKMPFNILELIVWCHKGFVLKVCLKCCRKFHHYFFPLIKQTWNYCNPLSRKSHPASNRTGPAQTNPLLCMFWWVPRLESSPAVCPQNRMHELKFQLRYCSVRQIKYNLNSNECGFE